MSSTSVPSMVASCLCGAVRFELTSRPLLAYLCHCSQCRRASGSAFGSNLVVRREHVSFLAGAAAQLTSYVSSPGKLRRHCPICRSPIWNEVQSLPHLLSVRAGLLGYEELLEPELQIFDESRLPWCDRLGDLEAVAGAMPVPPEWSRNG